MQCPKRFHGRPCYGQMRKGKALLNRMWVAADFAGDYQGSDTRKAKVGQTMSRTGPPQMVSVLKCHKCGYSRMA